MTQNSKTSLTNILSSKRPCDTGRSSKSSVTWDISHGVGSWTIRYRCPEGNLFVTIDHNQVNILRLQAYAGKHGTKGFTSAQALSGVVTLALNAGAVPAQIVQALRGFSHEDTNSLAFDVSSIPDGIGRAINDFIATREQDSRHTTRRAGSDRQHMGTGPSETEDGPGGCQV